MPLVVPGVNSPDATATSENWMTKLMGKKIGDKADETTFAKADLPKKVRVIPRGSAITCDLSADRLNVYLDEDGTVRNVNYG